MNILAKRRAETATSRDTKRLALKRVRGYVVRTRVKAGVVTEKLGGT